MQALLLAAHWFIYRTLMLYLPGLSGATVVALRMALVLLGFSFMAAAMLGFHHSGLAIRILYRVASIWLGFLNFFFGAACLCRLLGLALRFSPLAAELPVYRPVMASVLFSLAILISLYGLHNARRIRVRRMVIQLEGLPEVWRGRTILLISDLHLGNVNYLGYSRRMATLTASLDPEMVLIPGDLFDGSDTDPDRLLVPFRDLNPPLGIYFAMGNHDEFGGPAHYTAALARAGIHTLNSERVVVEGLQIVGIPYALSHDPLRLRIYLESLRLREGGASILLNHAPADCRSWKKPE